MLEVVGLITLCSIAYVSMSFTLYLVLIACYTASEGCKVQELSKDKISSCLQCGIFWPVVVPAIVCMIIYSLASLLINKIRG